MKNNFSTFLIKITPEYEAVILNYKEIKSIKAMCIKLINKIVDGFIKEMNVDKLEDIENEYIEMYMKVMLPRFEVESLIDICEAFGKERFIGIYRNMFEKEGKEVYVKIK